MRKVTTFAFALAILASGDAFSQELEYVFSPEGLELSDPFTVGVHNGARGLSGPYDLDGDGNIEVLLAQHAGGGGRVHVFEVQGTDSWELVYSTPVLDSTDYDRNARYAIGTDLDGDGLGEITFLAGADYSGLDVTLKTGIFVYEYDGQGDDNYGDYPATIGNIFELDTVLGVSDDNVYVQSMTAADIDGDGDQELLVPVNGSSAYDVFYIVSLSGDIETGQAAGTFATWNIESRQNPRDNSDIWGSGSPSEMIAADLNGDGTMDISYHSWNYFNFFNGTVNGTDEVTLPDETTVNPHIWATHPDDHVALFGGAPFDIDGDGNDEVFYPNFQTGNVAVLDYDEGQDVLSITANELVIDVIPGMGSGGIDFGDLDGDGNIDVIVGAQGYSAAALERGDPSHFLHVAEYLGGDPTDPSSYVVDTLDTGAEIDSIGFHTIYRDSAGVTSVYRELALSKQGVISSSADPVFPSGVAFLGDADGDGYNEVAISFQGVDDSLQVIDEVWNADSLRYDRTVRETLPAPVRPFLRIYEFADFSVAVEDPSGLPDGFRLHANYPNPFNPSSTIEFEIPYQAYVSVRVYDAMGRVIRTLVEDQQFGGGRYRVSWDATSASGNPVASGTYFYSLEHQGRREVRAMVVVK